MGCYRQQFWKVLGAAVFPRRRINGNVDYRNLSFIVPYRGRDVD